jgi:hypothetical protein
MIISKQNTFTRTRTQNIFVVVLFVPVISSSKQKKIGLDAVLLSCLVSELQKPPSLGLELNKLFRSSDPSTFTFWLCQVRLCCVMSR